MRYMRQFEKGQPPPFFESDRIRLARARIAAIIADNKKPKPEDWGDEYKDKDEVKPVLFGVHEKKCAFCERKRDRISELHVEHYRPKGKVTTVDSHKGYWWKAYDWDNLLLACFCCNSRYKKNEFPLQDEGLRAYSPEGSLDDEVPLIINPSSPPDGKLSRRLFPTCIIKHIPEDNTKKYFSCVQGLDEFGRTTVRLMGLNDEQQQDDRGTSFETWLLALKSYYKALGSNNDTEITFWKDKIKNVLHDRAPHSGLAREYFISLESALTLTLLDELGVDTNEYR